MRKQVEEDAYYKRHVGSSISSFVAASHLRKTEKAISKLLIDISLLVAIGSLILRKPCNTKINQMHHAFAVNNDIVRLNVPMQDFDCMAAAYDECKIARYAKRFVNS